MRIASPALTKVRIVARLSEVDFVKGHGTGNDFILLPDLDNGIDLTSEQVRWLCDRHRGLGADGVIRIVRSALVAEVDVPVGEFFMDYRNADGSLAEMCGNGARVMVRYLQARGLADSEEVVFATRGGLRRAWRNADTTITVDMGVVTVGDDAVTVTFQGIRWSAQQVWAPNPHAVVRIESELPVSTLTMPLVEPPDAFPDGVNVEFVIATERGATVRVVERGVGETLSCGTGACAVAATLARPDLSEAQIDLPGGSVWVSVDEQGHSLLRGPADLIARGTVLLP